jgi:hypothetical protein
MWEGLAVTMYGGNTSATTEAAKAPKRAPAIFIFLLGGRGELAKWVHA